MALPKIVGFVPFVGKTESKSSVIVVLVLGVVKSCLSEECLSDLASLANSPSLVTTCQRKSWVSFLWRCGFRLKFRGPAWRRNRVKQQQKHPLGGASPRTLPGDTTLIRLLTIIVHKWRFVSLEKFYLTLLDDWRQKSSLGNNLLLFFITKRDKSWKSILVFLKAIEKILHILCFYRGNEASLDRSSILEGF